MKQLATVPLMLGLGLASVYAQQGPLRFSGTAHPSPVVLYNGAGTTEYNFAGNGMMGGFTFQSLSASAPAQPPPSSGCALYSSVVAGGGVFRFADGSLLIVNSAQGTDCVQFTAKGPVAHCIRTFTIAYGTGRFKQVPAGGTVNLDETLMGVFPNGPGLAAVTGTGVISGVAMEE
jgi:hypothetical protein